MSNDRCSFCYQSFSEGDEVYITPCSHRYHHFCIYCCLDRSETCYKCEAIVRRSDIYHVYYTSRPYEREVPIVKNTKVLNKNDNIIDSVENKFNVLCAICTEFLTQTTETFATSCGHIFHRDCLFRWLNNSQTCPQCRRQCSQNNIIKLYFDSVKVDTNDQEEKLWTAEAQIKILNQEIKEISHHKQKLQDENNVKIDEALKLRKTIEMLEVKLRKEIELRKNTEKRFAELGRSTKDKKPKTKGFNLPFNGAD